MPIYRTYQTHCSHCGWRGRVGFGDVVAAWRRADGTPFLLELICPSCKEQVQNPRPDRATGAAIITPEQEEEFKYPPALSELMERAARRKAAQESSTVEKPKTDT